MVTILSCIENLRSYWVGQQNKVAVPNRAKIRLLLTLLSYLVSQRCSINGEIGQSL